MGNFDHVSHWTGGWRPWVGLGHRHIFFVTPLMVCLERQNALAPTMSPASPTATANQDSYGGVAGQNVDLCKHPQQPLATVERARCPERLQERCGARQMGGWKREESELVALKSAILGLYLEAGPAAHLAARVPSCPDELPPSSEGVSPPRPCELVEGTTISSCCSALSARCRGLTGGGSVYCEYGMTVCSCMDQ